MLGIVLALALLALQGVLRFRVELAAQHPGTKPALTALCRLLGCQVGLPKKPELIAIDDSSLQRDASGGLILSATLKNRAPYAVDFPHIELTLTDTLDSPLARRALAPADYLPPAIPVAKGVPGGGEANLRLAVDVGNLASLGYRLYIFYP